MTKSNITEYDNTAANNTDVEDVPLGENLMYPSHVNNAFREMMADLADINDGTVSLTSPSFAAASLTGNLSFGDNDKAIFGAGSDLQIYHDGSNSYIWDAGTGLLQLRTNGSRIEMVGQNGSEYMARFEQDGAVKLYYNNAQKLATTSTGIDVTGTVTADGLTVDGGATNFPIIVTSADQYAGIAFADNTTTTNAHVAVYADGNNLGFEAGNSERVRITSAGLVGIGTTSPDATLQVVASSTNSEYARFSSTDSRHLRFSSFDTASTDAGHDINASSSNGVVTISTGGTERMRIDSAGLVGIGTTSPATYGVDNADDLVIGQGDGHHGITISSYGTSNGTLAFSDQTGATVGRGFVNYDHNVNAMSFGTLSTERMRIDSSGNVLVGKTAMNYTSEGFAFRERGEAYITSDGRAPLLVNRLTSDGDIVSFRKDGTTVGSIGNNGTRPYFASTDCGIRLGAADLLPATSTGVISDNVVNLGSLSGRWKDLHLSGTANVGAVIATGDVTAFSDERLKDNIETLDGSKVYEMRGVSFTKDGEASSGVIAQELQKVAPELVNENGEYLSVAYGNVVGYLIEAIKDLKSEIEELKKD